MMIMPIKKLFSLAGILLLAACGSIIEVDDLRDNWNKGEIDPAFTGKWLDESGKTTEAYLIANKGGMYEIVNLNKKKNKSDLAKTLRAGNYRFYMIGPRSTYILLGPVKGDLLRYSIRKDKLYIYVLSPKAVRDMLKKKYSQQKNIVVKHTCTDASKKDSCYDYIEITKLDDDALKILSEIPNNYTYWECGLVLSRLRD